MSDLLKEIGRKAFHMLSLVYLAAYHCLGYARVVRWMIPWTAFVMIVETARLRSEPLNRFLFSWLGALARTAEKKHYSGIVHTTLGSFGLFLLCGQRSDLVTAGLLSLALGDAAAALVGKSIGKHRFPGSKKSIEGSTACFLTCAAAGAYSGFPAGCAVVGALAGTIIEFLPTTALVNDNLWMPIGVAVALKLCAG